MANDYVRARSNDIKISKVIGESEDGITLFIPKNEHGTFHLTEGDRFLSLMFVKTDGHGGMMVWTPWETI